MRIPFSNLITILALTVMASCRPGCGNGGETDSSTAVVAATGETSDMSCQALAKADSVMALMTLEQKVGQCFMPSLLTGDDEASLNRFASYVDNLDVGGVVLLKGNLHAAATMASLGASAPIPLFMAIDAEWGLGMRLEDAPGFPRNGRLPHDVGEELLYDYGREVGRECRRVGIRMVLGPVVDVAGNPDGVIGNRSFGSDPKRVADLGTAYARGIESEGVLSVAKHFPGHGSPEADSHKSLPVVTRTPEELDSIDLYPFRHYIEAGLSGIMVGHLDVPALDPLQLPAAVSHAVITGLLRGKMGFRGLVLTDALNMAGAEGFGGADALAAGADIIVGPANTSGEIDSVVSAVRTGRLEEAVIEDRCRRILFHKFLLGLDSVCGVSLDNLREDVAREAPRLQKRLSPQLP